MGMFKVLIVDDENIIRRGLKNIIDWKSYGCEIVGEASTGIDGIEKIKQFHPEIIITDICMPELDGLKMIKETTAIIPYCKIIILTGYRNFEYIKEALSLGAFDYILKPSKIEEITSILTRAVATLKIDIKKEEEIKTIKNNFENSLPLLRQKLLYDIMFNIHDQSEYILKSLKLYNLNIDNFLLIIVEIEEACSSEDSPMEKQHCQFGIINLFEDIFSEDFTVLNVPINKKQVAFIIMPIKNFSFSQKAYKNSEALEKNINSCFNLKISIAISTLGTNALELSKKTKEVMEELQYKQFMGKHSIILYEDFKNFHKPTYFNKQDYFEKSIFHALRIGNETNVKNILNEIYTYVDSTDLDISDIKIFYFNIIKNISYSISSDKSKDTANPESSEDNIQESINNCYDTKSLNLLFSEIIFNIASNIINCNPKTINSILQKAVEYMNINYSKPITLNKVAEATYVSSFYLSRLFTKHLGNNFVDYLNEIRIEKAKEYLNDTNYKAYEVAELIGINDAHYFSKLFKKHTGKTPSEYKNK